MSNMSESFCKFVRHHKDKSLTVESSLFLSLLSHSIHTYRYISYIRIHTFLQILAFIFNLIHQCPLFELINHLQIADTTNTLERYNFALISFRFHLPITESHLDLPLFHQFTTVTYFSRVFVPDL